MAKKRSRSKSKSFSLNETSAKAVVAFLVLLVAFSVLMLFNKYQENIISSSLQPFVLLVVILFALLIGLLFLLNPQRK